MFHCLFVRGEGRRAWKTSCIATVGPVLLACLFRHGGDFLAGTTLEGVRYALLGDIEIIWGCR